MKRTGFPHFSRMAWMLLIGICWLGVSAASQAQIAAVDQPTRKLGRGVANLFLCLLEVPKSWTEVKAEHGEVAGLAWGTFRGLGRSGVRLGVGVYEVSTFPFDKGPIVYPEFVVSQTPEDVWHLDTAEPEPY